MIGGKEEGWSLRNIYYEKEVNMCESLPVYVLVTRIKGESVLRKTDVIF